ncbi:hypothetical protein KP509_21G005300 [Ceratopteris richardii]|uniref:UspA domain-containing protein n=1 Tax=Ceratopteris richardii TaxID=49495 RepID=A0A8T2S765_CERRI|nr:hypothetical protein KP509_21G005300 [Ceratopteris richardii]
MTSRRIGVALDFSAGSKYALEWALKHVAKEGDHLICIVVNQRTSPHREMRMWEDGGSPLIPLSEFASDGVPAKYGVSQDTHTLCLLECEAHEKQLEVMFKIYWGDAREKVCDAVVDLPLDCIVLGSRGYGKLKRSRLGSVSNYVVNNASCRVTIVNSPSDIL